MLISLNTMCPALMLAANRKDKVRGRTEILVVSIRIRNGFSHVGAPSGSRCAIVAFGLNAVLEIIIDIHIGSPSSSVNTRCLDSEMEYGLSPNKLIIMIRQKNEHKVVFRPLMLDEKVRDNCW
jgi:hypothetical protein